MPHQKILTRRETANLLRVCPQTISRMSKKGTLNPIRNTPTGKVIFLQSDIDAYLTAQRSKGGAV